MSKFLLFTMYGYFKRDSESYENINYKMLSLQLVVYTDMKVTIIVEPADAVCEFFTVLTAFIPA